MTEWYIVVQRYKIAMNAHCYKLVPDINMIGHWFGQYQDNVTEWDITSVHGAHGLTFHWRSTIKVAINANSHKSLLLLL